MSVQRTKTKDIGWFYPFNTWLQVWVQGGCFQFLTIFQLVGRWRRPARLVHIPFKEMTLKHIYPIGQNSVTWPHHAAREAGKCGLSLGSYALCSNSRALLLKGRMGIGGKLAVSASTCRLFGGHQALFCRW